MVDDIYGEVFQRFGQEITGIGPTVGSFSFIYSTAKILIRKIRVLISSRGFYVTLLHNVSDFVHVMMVCEIRLFLQRIDKARAKYRCPPCVLSGYFG